MTSITWLMCTVPVALSELTFGSMPNFPWRLCGVVGALYTVVVFGGELLGRQIFSNRNAKPLWAIFAIHLASLTILLGLMLIAVSISPGLPNWLTDTTGPTRSGGNRSLSVLDILCIIAMFVVFRTERRLIYVENELDRSHSRNNPSS
jgi:hypothetical protein